MPKLIKRQKPKFIDELEEIEDIYDEVIYKEKIQNKIIEDREISGKSDIGINIDSCIFKIENTYAAIVTGIQGIDLTRLIGFNIK